MRLLLEEKRFFFLLAGYTLLLLSAIFIGSVCCILKLQKEFNIEHRPPVRPLLPNTSASFNVVFLLTYLFLYMNT